MPLMTDIAVKVMAEVLSILAIAVKEIKQGRVGQLLSPAINRSTLIVYSERYLRSWPDGRVDMEGALRTI